MVTIFELTNQQMHSRIKVRRSTCTGVFIETDMKNMATWETSATKRLKPTNDDAWNCQSPKHHLKVFNRHFLFFLLQAGPDFGWLRVIKALIFLFGKIEVGRIQKGNNLKEGCRYLVTFSLLNPNCYQATHSWLTSQAWNILVRACCVRQRSKLRWPLF